MYKRQAPVFADDAAPKETNMCTAAQVGTAECGRIVLNAILEKLDGVPFAESNMDDETRCV